MPVKSISSEMIKIIGKQWAMVSSKVYIITQLLIAQFATPLEMIWQPLTKLMSM